MRRGISTSATLELAVLFLYTVFTVLKSKLLSVNTAPNAPGQLYDLEADPGETTNLYFDRPKIVEELSSLLEE